MKLGYHYHVPVLLKNGEYYTAGYQAVFIESLAEHCEEVICFFHSAREEEASLMDTRLKAGNIRIIDLGPHTRAWNRIVNAQEIVGKVRGHFKELDLILLRGPSPMLPEFSSQAREIPQALLLVGDYAKGVFELPGSWFRRLLIYGWSCLNRLQQDRASSRALTFVNNRQLFKALERIAGRLVEIRTSTIKCADFFRRTDTCQKKPIRLLYTGRIDFSKGLKDIVEAVSLLVNRGFDLVLDLVGPSEASRHVWNELKKTAENKGISERILYHGNCPVGPELFKFYKNADIYVIASRASEGFPRTLWEAMAHGLPVVATNVGSIYDYAESAAVVVEPKRPDLFADAVEKVLNSPELRREKMSAGYELAEKSTLDYQVKNMVGMMEEWAREFPEQKTRNKDSVIFMAGNFLSGAGGVRGAGESLAAQFERQGLKTVRAGVHASKPLRFLERIVKAFAWGGRSRFGIIEVYSGFAFLWAGVITLIFRMFQTKTVLVLHGGGLPAFDRKHSRTVDFIFRKAFRIVTPSRYLREHFISRYPEIQYLPNGIDIASYSFRKREKPQMRLCWLRAFHSIYQPETAVEAIRLLREEFPEIHLVMAGPDQKDGSLQRVTEMIQKFSLEKNVEIKGCVDYSQVPSFLSRFDIFINTTSFESFGVALMQAAASGLCLVTTNPGEIPFLWTDGKDCLQVKPADSVAMADALRQVLKEPGLAGRISENARENARQYDWEVIMPQWRKLLGGEGL